MVAIERGRSLPKDKRSLDDRKERMWTLESREKFIS